MTITKSFQHSPREHPAASIHQLQCINIELQKQLDMCRSLSDEAADAICTVDLSGNVTYANKATAKLLKTTVKKLLGTHFSQYLDKESLAKGYQFFQLTKSGKKVHDELTIVDRNGRLIPVDFHTTPLFKAGKVVAVHAITRDIRRRKAMEKIHIESQKMQALYHFITAMAQEIKYPLKAISDRLNRTLQEFTSKDFEYIGYKEFKQIISIMENTSEQIRYCHDVAHRMINLNKRNLGVALAKCDLNEVVRNAARVIEGEALQANVRIKLRLAARLSDVAMSAMELNQVLTHLLVNAIQAMPTGGKIVVHTFFDKDKNRAVIQVKDEGVGIAKADLPHVFEPLFTTKHHGPHKGSGLGLSIVYSIVHGARGDIRIESSLRTGTTVRVELPMVVHR